MVKKSIFKAILDKRKAFVRAEDFCSKKALNSLNVSQFLGVINDNIFKLLTLYLLIYLKGVEHSSAILFWVGTIYVLPFLLFSSAAGVFADRFSKQKLIVWLKGVEVVITLLGVLAFAFQSGLACYCLLFLLSFQSAAFGPPKYSIIPEIVEFDKISNANGVITSFTYLAMIVGTFLASFITQITSRNYTLAATLCVVLAIIGFIASLYLPYTEPSRTQKRIKFFFLTEIYQTLVFCYKSPHLLTSILCAAFFLYIGAFFQLNIIPYAIESLHVSVFGGGYLFLFVAIGIALGSFLAGKISKNRVEVGLSCCSGIFLFVFLLLLSILPKSLPITLVILVLIGVCGGCFIVPFESYLQTNSPDKKRGQVIASSNFMSFCGVLLAPFSIYAFSGSFKLSAAQGFFVISLFTFLVAFIIIFSLSSIFLNFIGRKIFGLFYEIKQIHAPFVNTSPSLIVMPNSSTTKTLLLAGTSENLHFLILRNKPRAVDLFYHLFSSISCVYLSDSNTRLKEKIEKQMKRGKFPVLLLSKSLQLQEVDPHLETLGSIPTLYLHIVWASKRDLKKRHRQKEIEMRFEDTPKPH